MTDYEQCRAAVLMWLIRAYFRDLQEYYAGDEGRFTRMIVDQGKSLPTAHPHGWAQHIANCTTADALAHYRAEIEHIYRQLSAWGLPAELPPPQP